MFTLFAILSILRNTYSSRSRWNHSTKARHAARRGSGLKWVGEMSEHMANRLQAKFKGERIYSLYVGAYHRRSVA